MANHAIFLTRDCAATLIPAGDAVNLPSGTRVTVTHRLGGHFTVVSDYGMFRVAGKDADALGLPVPEEPVAPGAAGGQAGGPPSQDDLWAQLKTVFDPEIPVNIVDLGLVYSLHVDEVEPGQYGVLMHMTLTAPGCGMGPTIAEDARQRLLQVPGVASAHVELVFDPPWTQEMISEEGKMVLGLI
jgi:probable FeS assembly SUF system protein SufT